MSKGDLKKRKKKGGSKKKGVVYVAKRLKKYYPSRYSNNAEARLRAKEIIADLGKEKATWGKAKKLEKIKTFELYGDRYSSKKKKIKADLPVSDDLQLPAELIKPVDFFASATITTGLQNLPEGSLLRSNFFENDIECGLQKIDYYSVYFRALARRIDNIRVEKDSSDIYRLVFIKPFKENGKIITTVYIVDNDGDEFDIDDVFEPEEQFEGDIRGKLLDRQTKEVEDYVEEVKSATKKEKEIDLKEQLQLEKAKEKTAKAELKLKKASLLDKLMSEGKTFEQALKLLKKAGL